MLHAFLPTAVGTTFSFAFNLVFPIDFAAAPHFLALTQAADFVISNWASISFDGRGREMLPSQMTTWKMARQKNCCTFGSCI